jgi:hypothetical protein
MPLTRQYTSRGGHTVKLRWPLSLSQSRPVLSAKRTTLPQDPLIRSIRTRAAQANLALELARWLLRFWDTLPAVQRSALTYGLTHGGRVGDGPVMFSVPLSSLLEALGHLRRHPEPEE